MKIKTLLKLYDEYRVNVYYDSNHEYIHILHTKKYFNISSSEESLQEYLDDKQYHFCIYLKADKYYFFELCNFINNEDFSNGNRITVEHSETFGLIPQLNKYCKHSLLDLSRTDTGFYIFTLDKQPPKLNGYYENCLINPLCLGNSYGMIIAMKKPLNLKTRSLINLIYGNKRQERISFHKTHLNNKDMLKYLKIVVSVWPTYNEFNMIKKRL